METKQSPPPTVKRHMNSGHNWREFIEREHDTVDHLIQDSFANYCKNLNRNQTQPQSQQPDTHRNRNGGFGSPSSNELIQGNSYVGSLARSSSRKSASPPKQSSSHLSHLTMPRRSPPKTSGDLVASRKTLMDELNDANQQLAELIRDDLPENNIPRVQETAPELPPGIQELESLYAPMKNLLHPLPNARKYSGHSMPLPHPLERDGCRDAVAALPTYPSAYPRGRSSPPEEDEISVISVVNDIPPPLPPVQSHAVLQESLGHEIPRTPLLRKAQLQSKSHLHHGLGSATSGRGKLFKPSLDSSDWGRTPPLPPKRTSSKLSLLPNSASSSRPRHLSLDPNGSCGIYANTKSLLHRSSLMSTGSSENSSESSLPEDPHHSGLLLLNQSSASASAVSNHSNPGSVITTPTSEKSDHLDESSLGGGTNFSWPNYSVSSWGDQESSSSSRMMARERDGGSPLHINELEHRSVSQIGDAPETALAPSLGGHSDSHNPSVSGIYVKPFVTNHHNLPPSNSAATISSENHYMNLMYNALQRQGGNGSVESAMSPYIAMNNVRLLPNANVESISAIYATPQTLGRSKKSSVVGEDGKQRTRSSSTSRIQEVTSRVISRRKSSGGSGANSHSSSSSSRSKAKALNEFKELMREVERKRVYRVGLNLFNSQPDLGIEFLVQKDFLELSPLSVAKFLKTNPGLSKEKVGEYLGNLQSPFSMKVLFHFMEEFNFSGQRIDKSLRSLMQFVRVSGEAQKIEKIIEVFGKRYNKCNPGFASKLKSQDSVVTLGFAAMLLNTDLHTPNLREDRKMSLDDFTNNLRGVDSGKNFDPKLLKSIYKGIKKQEFIGGPDHVIQTQLIQNSILGAKRPNLAEPHRRLVCLCRLYEVTDIHARRVDLSQHHRDIFLFNDLLVLTKPTRSSSSSGPSSGGGGSGNAAYSYRDSFSLKGLEVTLFHTSVFHYGIQISEKAGARKVLLTLNAGSEHDRYKFVMDLQESIFEVDLMDKVLREIST